jgi:adenine-specific DNA glycosylase
MAIDQEDTNEAIAAGNRLMGRSSSPSSPKMCECLDHCRLQPGRKCAGILVTHRSDGAIVESPSSPKCTRCGFEQKEHAYNGACYGLCGEFVATPEAPGDVAEIVPDRGTIASLIRERFDPCPDLGQASYKAFEDSWNDGAEEIADAILALMSSPMTIEALADKLEAVSSLGGYIMESKEAAQIVTALRSISSLSAETASTDAAKTCNSYLERALAAEYELDKAVSEITRLSAATAQEAVAWRIKNDFGHWHPTCNKALADTWRDIEKMDVQPLYLSAVGGS